jgi:hypothetical protein
MAEEKVATGTASVPPLKQFAVNIAVEPDTPLFYGNIYVAGATAQDVSVIFAQMVTGPQAEGEVVQVKARCALTIPKALAKRLAEELARLAEVGKEKE